MIIDVGEGETVTVILASGDRLTGAVHWSGETLAEIGGWIIDTSAIIAWKPGRAGRNVINISERVAYEAPR